MAAMGARKLAKGRAARSRATPVSREARSPLMIPLAGGLNLVLQTVGFARVMERPVTLPVVGLPIMRDGFVTETGFLVSSL